MCTAAGLASDAAGLSGWVAAVRKAGQKQQQGKQCSQGLSEQQRQQLDELGFVWRPDTVEAKWHANYHRQVELYTKLKLTPVKVTMLRRLGVWQLAECEAAAPARPNQAQHAPSAAGPGPSSIQAAAHHVTPATKQGKRAVAQLLAQQQQRQQQLDKHKASSAETSTALAADITPRNGSDSDSVSDNRSDMPHRSDNNTNSPNVAFMLMLAQLQRWKKRHGSCHVPAGVFDKPQLAQWVGHIRQLRAAAAAAEAAASEAAANEAAAAAGDAAAHEGAGCSSEEAASSDSSITNSSSRGSTCGAGAGARPAQHPHLQQQQQPWRLQPWHIQELDAVGFVWQPSQEDAAWHARYHQLRHFKQAHHHLDVPAPLDKGAQAPDNWMMTTEAASEAAAAAVFGSGRVGRLAAAAAAVDGSK
ncbi:hypothetical protein COO60DRAFT_1698854 [Scenedesmus sp. NREL 46B-D3]|nr:hypothetical protein COO60DRAFT_1698854 [Scenedesmus sp. NREL 46B-D3]